MVFRCVLATLIMAICAWSTIAASAQSTTKRLVLKDGSYQIVTMFELQGDRVHYFSAERNEWEDIPDSLIDWDATNKYEKDRVAGKQSPEAVALDKELEEERQE